jgi:hypothetical protein
VKNLKCSTKELRSGSWCEPFICSVKAREGVDGAGSRALLLLTIEGDDYIQSSGAIGTGCFGNW